MRRALGLLAGLLSAVPAAAQDPLPWAASYFPYLFGNPTTGPMLIARYQYARQADYYDRAPFNGILAAEAGASALGSRFARARLHAPGLADGWRFLAETGAERESRFGFYGLGPDATSTSPPIPPGGTVAPYPFRARRARYWIGGEVTRRLAGALQAAAAAGVEHIHWSALPGSSVFGAQFGGSLEQTDLRGRLSVVLDLRDREFVTSRGFLGEAGLLVGDGGGATYTGWYGHLRGYLSPREGTVVAARIAGREVSSDATLGALFTLPGWERDVVALGGAETHRSFVRGRWAGRGLLIGSLEVRHNLLDVGDYGALTLVAFTDAGRVFDRGFDLTLSDLQVGYGGGIGLRVLRSAMLVFNFAGGPDGFSFSMGSGWAF